MPLFETSKQVFNKQEVLYNAAKAFDTVDIKDAEK